MLERAGVGTLMIGDGSSQAVTSPSFDGNLQLLHGDLEHDSDALSGLSWTDKPKSILRTPGSSSSFRRYSIQVE